MTEIEPVLIFGWEVDGEQVVPEEWETYVYILKINNDDRHFIRINNHDNDTVSGFSKAWLKLPVGCKKWLTDAYNITTEPRIFVELEFTF